MFNELLRYWPWLFLIVPALAYLSAGLIGPRILDIVSTKLPPQNSGHPLELVLISDLHSEFIFIQPEKVLRALRVIKPDVLVFAGDWCAAGRRRALRRAANWKTQLETTCVELGIPFFAVRGNHDKEEVLNLFRSGSCVLLENASVTVHDRTGTPWQLTGLNSKWIADRIGNTGCPSSSGRAIYLSGMHSDTDGIPYERQIIAAHNPDTILALNHSSGRFFLSGHFHGGQIWTPFNLEFKCLRGEKMAEMGYHRGAFDIGRRSGYITRGLGCVLLPFRVRSRPELTHLKIYPAGSQAGFLSRGHHSTGKECQNGVRNTRFDH